MAHHLNPEQFDAILALDEENRCLHLIGKVGDEEKLWGVRNSEGWLVPVAPDDFEYFPIWPHPEYAQKIADLHFPGHTATEISLDDFMKHWLPKFEADNVKVAVFPNVEWDLWVVDPPRLLAELEEELEQYG
ncbi:DUF2750 domain-containing protein [Roseibacillus persicicus]|uniref:DUF2750 domain-containing protein n=1 Tax=Roseibacillus persicicus TaxID=454148 RepID=UPI00280C556E|nr:DUF2750 domain-containing protein [Roseibacillus persicicus]MDQ8192703.1 DUF2750 domain-containing protein [Roseibacillus persicicus]